MRIGGDLEKVEEEGGVVVVWGGVECGGGVGDEGCDEVKSGVGMREKGGIGKVGGSVVEGGSCMYVDGGRRRLGIGEDVIEME